ncbi:MAG: serine/threonine-protein kinase, partial [Planctomycetaceae bacterium]
MSIKLSCARGHKWDADSASVPCPVCGAAGVEMDAPTAPASPDELPPPPRGGARRAPRIATDRDAGQSMPETLGRYRIVRRLGEGGMGAVYLAHDEQLDRQVALKVPHFAGFRDSNIMERFAREARAAATLDHPNICSVYDVGEIDGIHYLTMAYVPGQTLASLIGGNLSALPQQGVADLVRKLAAALAEAHDHGVIHRDLKPANVMINRRHEPVIMDFGLARREGKQDSQITAEGAVMGTPAYMSPEQVAGDQETIGPASDVYALGVIMYELLTGRRPFEGSLGEVLSEIATTPAPPLTDFRSDVDPALNRICLKALNKKISDRFANMREFDAALTDWLGTAEIPATPDGAKLSAAPSRAADGDATEKASSLELAAQLLANLAARIESGELGTNPEITIQPRRRRPWWVWAGGAAALTLLIVLALLPFLGSPEPQKAPVTVHIDKTYVNAVFLLDGKKVTRKQLQSIDLDVGKHELVVKRNGEEIARKSFDVPRGGEPFTIDFTPDDVIRPSVVNKTGGNRPPPRIKVDRTLEIWSTPYYNNVASPLRTAVTINDKSVETFSQKAYSEIAKTVRPGWNTLKLITRPHYPVKRQNSLSFAFGPATGKPKQTRSMKPVLWRFYNWHGWALNDGTYAHRLGVKQVELGIRLYYAGFKRETRKVKKGDFVIQSHGYWKDRNPSVTATVFINGIGLTTFTAARRQAVITDLLRPGL